jgi:DNA-binding beta-propeller fold protein YncE
MRKTVCVLGVVAVAMCLLSGRVSTQSAEGPYKFLKEIAVGGTSTSWDYASVDPAAKRLYVTNGTRVVVIDTEKDAVVGEIGPTSGVHGFAIAPELGKGFASSGRENKAAIVDLKTLQILSKVDTGVNPDAIFYEPTRQEVYTFNGGDASSTVFDAKTGTLVATIKLSGKPEFAQEDQQAGRIYNNIEDKNEVAVIDIKTHSVVASWPIAPGEEASGLAIDLAHHRLFIGAGGTNLMVMMDSTNGKVLGKVPIGPGVDANSYDPVTNYAFASSGGDGTVTVAQATSATDFKVVQTLKTHDGSRTMTLDPKTHKIYLAAAEYQAPATPPQPGQRVRRTAVPGSFKVLVYGLVNPPKG